MKKQNLSFLLIITIAFVGFTAGFFFGRNQEQNSLHISVSPSALTQPIETTSTLEVPEETTQAVQFPISINTADKADFMALPGIGEVLALRIIAYREEHGSFTYLEELMNVEGIGEGRMEEIMEYITIGG